MIITDRDRALLTHPRHIMASSHPNLTVGRILVYSLAPTRKVEMTVRVILTPANDLAVVADFAVTGTCIASKGSKFILRE